MKELDVLLERFIEQEGASLDQGQWPDLEDLLAMEDDRLWDFVQQPENPEARTHRALLLRIRNGPAVGN